MEMEKTKAELYLERLERWRAEKQIKATKSKKIATASTDKNVHVPRKRPVSSVLPQPKIQPKSTKQVSQKPCTTARPPKVTTKKMATTAQTKVLKPAPSESQTQLMEKLKDWKSHREVSCSKSAQKKSFHNSSTKNVTSTIKSQSAKSTSKSQSTNVPRSKFVNVKSRLFDYKSTKPNTGKENKVALNRVNKPVQQRVTTLKRRHSEASHEPLKKKKPVGILKRKSCIGSFDTTTAARKENEELAIAEVNNEISDDVFTDTENVAMVNPRNVRFVTPEHGAGNQGRELRKTPKITQNRSQELNDWLKAKGRTPSKFRHLLCFHGHHDGEAMAKDPHTKTSLTVDELSEQNGFREVSRAIDKLDVIEREQQETEARQKLNTMLEECMTLFDAGCPIDAIVPWLDDIYQKIPIAQTSAQFYICKAKVVKNTHDLDAVLKVFEDATVYNAQPKEELAKCLTETIKYVTEEKIRKVKRRSRTPRRSQVQEENMFESSSVVYAVTQATPISEGKKRRSRADTPAPCQVITPVRRSTRRSLQNLPDSLKDKSEKFSSLSNLDEQSRDRYLFQPNLALDKLLAEEEEEEQKD